MLPILSTGKWGEKKMSCQRFHCICNGTPQSQSTEHENSTSRNHTLKLMKNKLVFENHFQSEESACLGRRGNKSQMRTRIQQPTEEERNCSCLALIISAFRLTYTWSPVNQERSEASDVICGHMKKHPLCSTEKSRMQLIKDEVSLEQFIRSILEPSCLPYFSN